MSAIDYKRVPIRAEQSSPNNSPTAAIEKQGEYQDHAVLPGKTHPVESIRVSVVVPLLNEADNLSIQIGRAHV